MIYILGERPGPNTDPDRPLYPHTTNGAAARLYKLFGMTPEEYLRRTVLTNAFYGPLTGLEEARRHVQAFLQSADFQPFIVLGKGALTAMPPTFRKMEIGDMQKNVLLLPHTSGVCRVWNDKEYMSQLQSFVRELIDAA